MKIMDEMNPSALIDQQIAGLPGWRGELFARLRRIIGETDPELAEGWKWGTAVWLYHGTVCAVGAFKEHMKINFFKGASLPDPQGLFNSGLEAKTSRTIDLREGDPINEPALKELIREAMAANKRGGKK
jgi:hypothetical protein